MAARQSTAERFWSKVDRRGADECWPWKASILKSGYGCFHTADCRTISAHRMAWILANGDIPPGMDVCHRCDNRPCVNPGHLFVGTRLDNMRDAVSKGRVRIPNLRGAAIHGAKLSEEDVRRIRSAVAIGESDRAIAARFSVSRHNIRMIRRGRTWRHVA